MFKLASTRSSTSPTTIAREFLAWMPPLRHWPRKSEPFKPEDSEIFRWMLKQPRILEELDCGTESLATIRASAARENAIPNSTRVGVFAAPGSLLTQLHCGIRGSMRNCPAHDPSPPNHFR